MSSSTPPLALVPLLPSPSPLPPSAQPQQHTGFVELLYANHHPWLLAWLRRKLGDAAEAADVAQDTFLRIIASRDLLLGSRIQEPRAYLTTTAQRLMVDRSRRWVIEQAYLSELALVSPAGGPSFPSPEEVLMAVQALEQIGAALDGLPPRAREAFLRHYLDEQTQAEVAEGLGVSKRMVQKYLVQALLHCRAQCPAMAAWP